MAEAIVEVSRLTKIFKSNKAVHQADFKIAKGEIFGLIGKNGAGKSTLLKMISGLMHPTAGEIHLFGSKVAGNHGYFERMGVLIEEPGIFPNYSAYRNLELIAVSYGLKDRKKYIEEMLQLVRLDARNQKKVKNYSMGMKQRLGIAAALMGSPDVLILDEPINGLDPQGISDIRKLILELHKIGMTIIISSHILEELSKVATKYAIIHDGEILENISKEELLLQCEERIELEADATKEIVPLLENEMNIKNYKVISNKVIHIYDANAEIQEITKLLVHQGMAIHSITKYKQSLEDYFLKRTGGSGDFND